MSGIFSSVDGDAVCVLVHISSVDSFRVSVADEYGDNVARAECQGWIDEVKGRLSGFKHVVVVDQGWPSARFADAARAVIKVAAPSAIYVAHDEDRDGWRRFKRLMQATGVLDRGTKVTLGGFWRDGCVARAMATLNRLGCKTTIDEALAPAVEDVEIMHTEDDFDVDEDDE